jgi:hypothetical protein
MHACALLSVTLATLAVAWACEVDQYEAYPARDGFSQVCEGNALENYTLTFEETDPVIAYLAAENGVDAVSGALYGFNRTTEYGWEFSPNASTAHKEKLFSYMYFYFPPNFFDGLVSGYDVDPYNLAGMQLQDLKQLSYFMNVSAGPIQPGSVPHFSIYYSAQDHGSCDATLNVSRRLNYQIAGDTPIVPLNHGDYLVYADLQIKPTEADFGTKASLDAENSLPANTDPHDIKHRIVCAIALSTSSTADAATFSIQAVHIHQKRFYMRGTYPSAEEGGISSVVDPYNMPETSTTTTTTMTTTTTKHIHVHEEDSTGYVFAGVLILGILIILLAMLLQKKEAIRYTAHVQAPDAWLM